ncbi:MAG: CoF synthetase, partial [Urechidicola sp.]|nr:CoF synthetase [Urechidicola sp.]
FKTFLNKNKKIRNSADTIYFAKKSGFDFGKKLVYIRLWDEQHKKNKLSFWVLNIMRHDITKLKDKDIELLCFRLNKNKQQKGFLAYASAYDSICQYLDKIKSEPIDCNVVSIIAISEHLSDYAKKRMEYYFGCPVVSRYSASETGIIAQQKIGSYDFDINWGSYIVEVLKIDSDSKAELGELGRVVITDLFNYAVPMVRYDTGDLGVLDKDEKDEAPVLKKVEGRKMDMLYDTKGQVITSHIVHQICLYKGIKQYQLIQDTKKSYRFKINATSEFNQEKELKETYLQYFGNDAQINVDYVDDIPLLSSGKRKKVINNVY